MRSSSLFVVLMWLFSVPAFASETLEVISPYYPLTVHSGRVASVPLAKAGKVEKLIIQAEGASRSEAMFDVMVDGVTKGTIHVPGRDPSYIVTIAANASSIEFRSLSGGAFKITKVLAILETPAPIVKAEPLPVLPAMNDITLAADEAIQLTRKLALMVTPEENRQYLLPIKVAAGHLAAVSNGHGAASKQSLDGRFYLIAEIDAAKGFFKELMARDFTTETVMGIWEVRSFLAQTTGVAINKLIE